jgi:hypothetical protein
MRSFGMAAALVAVLGFAGPASAQGTLAGNWVFSFNTPNGMIDADATIKVDGQKLSGTMNSQAGEVTFTGEVKEKSLTISFEVQTPQGNISITMQGEQKGDGLAGTFDFGQGTGDWTGKKK